jgi:Ca2+-binding EF-hand superfamily protein
MTENTDLNYLRQFINPIGYISKFHEAIIAFLCVNFISVDEENNLRKLFRYMDKDGKNAVGKEDMRQALEEIDIKINEEELDKIFETVDENGTGLIEYQEFIRNACDIKKLLSESNLKNVFHAICGDKNLMSGEDIKKFIFHDAKINEQALKEYFDSFGMKYESSIDFDDFCRMIKKNKKYAPKKKKKRKSKYEFKGPVIDEAEKEEEQESNDEINKNEFDGDNEEEIEIEEEKNEIKDDNIEESGKLNNGNSEHETSASNGIKV